VVILKGIIIDLLRINIRFLFFSNVLVYRLGGSTYECSIIRTMGGCFQTIASINGFENSGDAFTDLLTDVIAEEFQKYTFIFI